jgi:acetyltransferase-like isoleucine patch superfamily enzyme/dTDP-4-dehydrorhamnose 3,5-epimerase-like enzyme
MTNLLYADASTKKPADAFVDARAVVSATAGIGPGCTIASGAVVSAGVVLEANVEVGPNAVFVETTGFGEATPSRVERGVRIGANAIIYPGLTLATLAVVLPGAVVTRSVPPRAIVEGNPATIVGYVGTEPSKRATPFSAAAARGIERTAVNGVSVHTFPVVPDLRGNLTVGDFDKEIPFVPLRYFMVFGVPSKEVRGEHAHKECHQFLICVRGSCAVVADDGTYRVEVALDAPNRGLYLPPMTWGVQYKYSADALLLVFASHYYNASDYVRDYSSFLALTAEGKR